MHEQRMQPTLSDKLIAPVDSATQEEKQHAPSVARMRAHFAMLKTRNGLTLYIVVPANASAAENYVHGVPNKEQTTKMRKEEANSTAVGQTTKPRKEDGKFRNT